jgi:hypothetical protein
MSTAAGASAAAHPDNAGAVSAPVPAADNTPAVDPAEQPPERTGVVFEWPETDPAAGGACKPGHYVGEFSCRLHIIATDGPGAFDLSGVIDMQLEQSADGELLRIRDGKFLSTAAAAIPVSADIVGELQCSRARFEGRLENGIFSVALGLPIPFTEGTFSGPLESDYDRDTAAMTGLWNMVGELDGFPGSCMDGTWSVHWIAD